jgi:hypothetical protein
MLSYSKQVTSFLNDLEEYIPLLVNKTCKLFIDSDINNVNSIILHANDSIYLSAIANLMVKRLFQENTITKRIGSFSYINNNGSTVEIDYEYSDYHFELVYSEKHIPFIKSIIKNKNISKQPFIFIIKNIDATSKASQLPIKKLIDNNGSAIFIFLSKRLNKIDAPILSRSMLINISFKVENIYNVFKIQNNDDTMSLDEFILEYQRCNSNIISFLIQYEYNFKKLRIFDQLDKLLEYLKKEKKMHNAIMKIREYAYRSYHVTFALQEISKYIIEKYKNEDYINEIVNIASTCDYDLITSNKDILVYEKFFIKLLRLINPNSFK